MTISPLFALSKFGSSMRPKFHVILVEERLRVYKGSLLLEAYISTSNEPCLSSATDLNVCWVFWRSCLE